MESNNSAISIKEIHRIPWSKEFPETILTFEQPGEGGYFDLKGPRSFPKRPLLELFPASGGVAGRIRLGDDSIIRQVLIFIPKPKQLTLPHPPTSMLVDVHKNLWALTRAGLYKLSAPEYQSTLLGLPGTELIQGPEDNIWLLHSQLDTASLLTNQGEVTSTFPWKSSGNSSISINGVVATLSNTAPLGIRTLSATGQRSIQEVPKLEYFEKLLDFDRETVTTLAGATVKKYGNRQKMEIITIQAAGLASNGQAFVSGRIINDVVLWQHGNHKPTLLKLPDEADWIRPFYLIWMRDGSCGVKGDYLFIEYDETGKIITSHEIDESLFQEDIFPSLNETGNIISSGKNSIWLSSSNSDGISIFEIEFPG